MLSNPNEFNSEKYFYIPDYRLNKSPLFCTQEFSDPAFPEADDVMIKKTFESVEKWQNKIEKYADTDSWNFEFRKIPERSSFADLGCDATIMFERFPPLGQEIVRARPHCLTMDYQML